jgi:hypothetical protein
MSVWVAKAMSFRQLGVFGATLLTGGLLGHPENLAGQQSPAIEFDVFARLGGIEAPEELAFGSQMLSVTKAADGRTLVLDPMQSLVRLIALDGTVGTFGGPGRGPGELRAPVAMLVDTGGQILIATAFDGRYTLYDAEGRFIETRERPIRATNKNQFAMARDHNGILIDQSPIGYRGFGFVAVQDGGHETLLEIDFPPLPPGIDGRAPIDPSSDWARVWRSFRPSPTWALSHDAAVWFVDADQRRLRRLALRGDTLLDVPLQAEKAEFSPEETAVIRRGLREVGLSRTEASLRRRSVGSLIPNRRDGSVLAQRVGEFSAPTGLLDHYSAQGELLGTIDVGNPVSMTAVHYFSSDTLYLVTIGPLDVPVIEMGTLAGPTSDRNE